jgi:hypothetical protein
MGQGSTLVDHLGTLIDTVAMTYSLPERKIIKMKEIAAALLKESSRNRRWVSEDRLATACGITASFILAYPLARFHSRAMQCDLTRRTDRSRIGKVQISRAGMTDLIHWRSLCRGNSRDMHEPIPRLTMHSDASDLGYGGTLGTLSGPGQPGEADGQDLWGVSDRRDSISVRELRAVRLLMSRHFAEELSHPLTRRLLLWEDNQAVVAAINKMTSKSTAMMSELRKL